MSKSNVLSDVSVKALSSWAGKKVVTSKGLIAVVDALVQDGIVADDLVAAKASKEESPVIKACKAAIIAGWTSSVQQLLVKDTKTLTEQKKAEKRYWQQQIGSCMKDVRNALKRREDTGGAGRQRSLKEMIHVEVTKRLAQVREDEKPNYDSVKLVAALSEVLKLTKA